MRAPPHSPEAAAGARASASEALRAETIAAIGTPAGRGAVGMVRVSGARAAEITRHITGGEPPEPGRARLATFRDDRENPIDRGLVLFFRAPHSFTGEDVVEFQGHGGPVLMDMLLASCLSCGARPAQPGEFSERAFLNGKLDLAQAEAVADLIDGATQAAVRGAARSLRGEFSSLIDAFSQGLLDLRAYVEAALDFPEEEVDFLGDGVVLRRLTELAEAVAETLGAARRGALLTEGLTVVLVGAPNVGKSSLLNQLAGEDRAIVTAVPGTTRDLLGARIEVQGIPIRLIDTAGLRDSADPVELEGIRRALAEAEAANLILVISDLTRPTDLIVPDAIDSDTPVLFVQNKVDLVDLPEGEVSGAAQPQVRISALSGAGIGDLRAQMLAALGVSGDDEGTFTARRRHIDALTRAAGQLATAMDQFRSSGAGELLAEDLRRAHESLSEITGRVSADDVLGDIFGKFCIGK